MKNKKEDRIDYINIVNGKKVSEIIKIPREGSVCIITDTGKIFRPLYHLGEISGFMHVGNSK